MTNKSLGIPNAEYGEFIKFSINSKVESSKKEYYGIAQTDVYHIYKTVHLLNTLIKILNLLVQDSKKINEFELKRKEIIVNMNRFLFLVTNIKNTNELLKPDEKEKLLEKRNKMPKSVLEMVESNKLFKTSKETILLERRSKFDNLLNEIDEQTLDFEKDIVKNFGEYVDIKSNVIILGSSDDKIKTKIQSYEKTLEKINNYIKINNSKSKMKI